MNEEIKTAHLDVPRRFGGGEHRAEELYVPPPSGNIKGKPGDAGGLVNVANLGTEQRLDLQREAPRP